MVSNSIPYDLKRLNKLQPTYIKSTSEYKLSSSMTYYTGFALHVHNIHFHTESLVGTYWFRGYTWVWFKQCNTAANFSTILSTQT